MHAPSDRAAPTSVLHGSFPTWTISEICSVRARLTAPSNLYLVICIYDLGVRRLSINPGSGGSTVFYAYATNSSHSVCVFDASSIYINQIMQEGSLFIIRRSLSLNGSEDGR